MGVVWSCPACGNINEDQWEDQHCQCGMCSYWTDEKERHAVEDEDLLRLKVPSSINIEGPYECPCCRNMTEYSYQLPGHEQYNDPDGNGEAVGFMCIGCGWSNAGWRSMD